MKRLFLSLMLISLISLNGKAQEKPAVFGIKFSGFIKTDMFYDSRQSAAANGLREGHFYLFPDGILYDADSNDINASPSVHMLSIQTRLVGKITGPDAFGAKTSGVIESEFFGTSETDLNGFRLRHGYLKLDWVKSSLLIGQTWHPMFPAESFPGTLSFNTGAPFIPFSRNPQIRYTYTAGPLKIKLTAYAQRDFTTIGPDGGSNKYLRNSSFPAADIQFQFYPDSTEHVFTLGADYKTIMPEIKTSKNYVTDETISAFSAYLGMKLKFRPVTVKLMGVYAQNATDIMMIGGFAISDTLDKTTGLKEYVNYNTASYSVDIHTNGTKIQAGLFAGYSKNMGTTADTLNGKSFGRGLSIDHLFRISPRLVFTSGKVSLGLEYEMTQAAYGLNGPDGKVTQKIIAVSNNRILLTAIYNF